MKITNTTIKDYTEMYDALKKMGYDPNEDIHQQFCDRHNLPYKVRNKKHKNRYSYMDCLMKKEKDNQSGF